MRFYLFILFIILYSCNSKNDFQKGNEEFLNKNYSKAIEYYLDSIDSIPKKSRDLIYRKLAISYFNINNYDNVINYAQKSLKINPEEESLRYILVDSYLKLERTHKAIYEIKKIEDSDKKFNKLLDAYIIANNYHEAKEIFDKITIKVKNKNELLRKRYEFAKKLLNLKKHCREKNKFFANIEENYKIDNIKDFYENYYKALKCYKNNFKKTLIDKKVKVLKKLLVKNNEYYYNELFDLRFLEREIKNAKELFKNSKNLNPKQKRLIYMEALLKYNARDYNNSFKLFKKYLKLDDNTYDNNYSNLFISKIYTINEEYTKAIELNEDILKKDKKDENAYFELFTLYRLTNNEKKLEKIKKMYLDNQK